MSRRKAAAPEKRRLGGEGDATEQRGGPLGQIDETSTRRADMAAKAVVRSGIVMPARDTYHQEVRRALERDGWTITRSGSR